jgi:hypothetical protein
VPTPEESEVLVKERASEVWRLVAEPDTEEQARHMADMKVADFQMSPEEVEILAKARAAQRPQQHEGGLR